MLMDGDNKEPDRLAIPLDPVEALRALLKVDPDSEPAEAHARPTPQGPDAEERSPED